MKKGIEERIKKEKRIKKYKLISRSIGIVLRNTPNPPRLFDFHSGKKYKFNESNFKITYYDGEDSMQGYLTIYNKGDLVLYANKKEISSDFPCIQDFKIIDYHSGPWEKEIIKMFKQK